MSTTPTAVSPPRRGFNAALPTTTTGKWSAWLAVGFVVMALISMLVFAPRGTSNDPEWNAFARTYLPYWGVTMAALGLGAGATGLWALVKQQERSLVTLVTMVPGLMMAIFLLGEFLVPH